MAPTLNPFAAAPDLMQKFVGFGTDIQQAGLEPALVELVKIRASQINDCAACLEMHTTAARKAGESEDRLECLGAWRETSLYSSRERAALEWTEALTLVVETRAPDAAYEAIWSAFNEREQVALTLLIVVINGFNRVNVGFRVEHVPGVRRKAA